ncbi:MAG: sensor domain-containing diguanylate cyclase [Aquabacterium sp.]|nr:sensor domain-containing diguanylate cyclase [Aquabacterium sp.]
MSNHNELLASHRVLSMLESACEYSEKIIDDIPSVFAVLNQDNRIIRANKAFCDLVGCSMEDALHLDFASFFSTENRAILLHHFNYLRTSPDSDTHARFKLEVASVSADQTAKPFFWRIFKPDHVSEAEGQVISIIGDDLSGLYQSELKLMSIFSSIPLGLMVMNRHGYITEVLSEYCHVLLNKRTLNGESLREVLITDNPDLQSEISVAFDMLRDCTGQPVEQFTRNEASFNTISQLKIAGLNEYGNWIKTRFQPIINEGLVDRYMVIMEDNTGSQLALQQIEKAVLLGKQAQALYECAIRDPLSGLYTRLFMNDSISRLIASSKRGNLKELAIVMFDIDNFKSVNDTYGHGVGDQVIKEFGNIILKSTRDTDIAVRYGGEEFILALPSNDTHPQSGYIVAERIRKKLEQTEIDVGGGKMLRVTTSCGLSFCTRNDTLDSVIVRADKYLYAAKQSGKNKVCFESTNADAPTPIEGGAHA